MIWGRIVTRFIATAETLSRLFLVGVALTGCVYAANPLAEPGFPQSCGVQLKTDNFTIETLDRVHRLGFRTVRRGFYWSSIEKEKGAYSFSDYDAQMKHAKELGLTIIGVLFSGNKKYEDDGQGGIQTEAGRRGFANFAAALAEHYKDHDVIWEVWNEPNVRTFWRKNGKHNSDEFAEEYTALVKEVVPAMLKADPDCFVVAGSVSNYWEPSYQWTESCFKKGILETGIRGWSVHPYGVKTPEEFAIGHARTRELLKQHGAPDFPILNTERGFAVKETSEGWSGGSKERAREFQAWNFVRQFMVDQLHGVGPTIWYEWDGAEFGLTAEGATRPVHRACRTMLEQLDGYRLVRRIEADSDLDYGLLFANEDGDQKLVAWTAPPPKGDPDEAEDHLVAIHIVRHIGGVGLEGKTRKVEISTDAIQLTLSGAPQYVAIPSGLTLGRCTSPVSAGVTQPPAATRAKQPQRPVELPTGAVDLNLFDGRVVWKFMRNTGQGSFTLGKDDSGKSIGILKYDFTKSRSKSTPYVIASAPVSIAEGATAVVVHARSPIAQQLTFRLIDSSGQTHQHKKRIKGTGGWEAVRISLTRRLEHWGGANDSKIHYPIQAITFNVPLPGESNKTGKVEYADVVVDDGGS